MIPVREPAPMTPIDWDRRADEYDQALAAMDEAKALYIAFVEHWRDTPGSDLDELNLYAKTFGEW